MDTSFPVHDTPAHPYPKQKAGLMSGLLVPVVFLLLVVAIGVGAFFVISRNSKQITATNYEECTKLAGSIIQEMYPATCITADGARFTQQIEGVENAPAGMVVLIPKPGSTVTSPLSVQGTVPAGWMFEGGFPLLLTDENGVTISQILAKEVVPGSWTSGNPVTFEAELVFQTTSKSGFLVLQKDNPSGLPENAQSHKIPVNFDSAVTIDTPASSSPTTSNTAAMCSSNSGQWDAQYTECTGVTSAACGQMGGTFNECASACRHNADPNAACIQMCVAVCDF